MTERPRSDLVVYHVIDRGAVVYVGQGAPSRAVSWRRPNVYLKTLGATPKPTVLVVAEGLTRAEALAREALEIAEHKPIRNKAKFASGGGLVPWNTGLVGVGGRPRGIPASDETKAKLSIALQGKSTAWLTGKTPWNKGLTKADPRVAKGVETYGPKRESASAKIWAKRRAPAK